MIKYHKVNSGMIAEIISGSGEINNPQDMLDIMVSAGYEGCNKVIIHEITLPKDFFDLKSGLAGEILQKFSNYRMKLAIVGNFKGVKSKSLRDFIRESNRTGVIRFVETIEDALL
jgi:hypothetical protein